MEGKAASKELLQVQERPCDNNTKALNGTKDSSISNSLGSTLLSLSLNNSEQPLQNQEQPLNQLVLLQTKLEEVKKENQNLRFILNYITEHYAALQNQLLLAMQQQQLSESPRYNRGLKDNRQDGTERPVLLTRQFLHSVDHSPSEGSTKERSGSVENIQTNIGRNLSCASNVEGKISNHMTSQGGKNIEDQASEASCRKARVSIRARLDFSLVGDGCQWRKYGQKTSKGNPCPRAYYRCSMGTACPVRKQVQRCSADETVLITTYEGTHNHALPPAARTIASTTSAALNTFLSGSITSLHCNNTISNSSLFSPLSTSSAYTTGLATFSTSGSCPTITLDLTQPSNNSNCMKLHRAISSNHREPFPLSSLDGHTQQSGRLYLSSKLPLPAMIPSERNLALVDVVSAAITKDPSVKAALVAAVSSLNENRSEHQSITIAK